MIGATEGDLGTVIGVTTEGDLGTVIGVTTEGDLGTVIGVTTEGDLGTVIGVTTEGDLGTVIGVTAEGNLGPGGVDINKDRNVRCGEGGLHHCRRDGFSYTLNRDALFALRWNRRCS